VDFSFYYDLNTEQCESCLPQCTSCHASNTCDALCNAPQFVPVNGECRDACSLNVTIWVPDFSECQVQETCTGNQFYIASSNECQSCHSNCVDCTSFQQCDLCEVPYELIAGATTTCLNPCLANNTIIVPATKTCEPLAVCIS